MDPSSYEFAVAHLGSQEAVEGFVSGLAARQAVEIAMKAGSAQPTDESTAQSTTLGQGISHQISIGAFHGEAEPRPGERPNPLAAALAQRLTDLESAGQLDRDTFSWRGIDASAEWSDEQLGGYIAGLFAGRPFLYGEGRERALAGDTIPNEYKTDLPKMITLLDELRQEDWPQQARLQPLRAFPRNFHLREVLHAKYATGGGPRLSPDGLIEAGPVVPILDAVEEVPMSEERSPVQIEVAEEVGEAAVEAVPVELIASNGVIDEPLEFEPLPAVSSVEPAAPSAAGLEADKSAPQEAVSQSEEAIAVQDNEPVVTPDSEAVSAPEGKISGAEGAELLKQPELSQVFSSGSELERTLADPEVDPDYKQAIEGVVTAWRDLQHATTVNQVWEEYVGPRLSELKEVLPGAEGSINTMLDVTERLGGHLQLLERAISYGGDMQTITDALRQIQLGETREMLESFAYTLSADNPLAQAGLRLQFDHEGGADEIRRSLNYNKYAPLDGFTADEITADVGDRIADGQSLAEIRQALDEKMADSQVDKWRRRSQVLEEVTTFARIGGDTTVLAAGMRRLNNEIEMMLEEMRRMRFDEATVVYIFNGSLRPVHEELETAKRMILLTKDYSEQV